MLKTVGYAAYNSQTPLRSFHFERRQPGPSDVRIEILYCGVCHSDLHQVRNEWRGTTFPIVPGHEIVGKVVEVGSQVTSFKLGDLAGVGCMVDSCGVCADCLDHQEQFCDHTVFTYNSPDKYTGKMTYGGYSNQIVVDQDFVLRVSDKLELAAVAPLLCAGITTYSPLRHWQIGKGHKVGIVGLGGLGHMGLKFAHAFGAEVVLFTTSPGKEADAKRLGASEVVISKHADEMEKHLNSFDFILNTVAAQHDLDQYLSLLKRDGTMCLVGVPSEPHPSPNVGNLIFRRRALAGSLIGGIRETQEMLDFCAEHGIVSDIELIPMAGINDAYQRMLKSDVKYRFVIDMATLQG
ncbi:Alcohol dehydrogenase (EC 1.1.1.1) [Methylomonas albis]|uniref:NAD(P)-dependent alcohol dehydrogenase n=1 Tax=Methylomonas albis TaxID=1854563 RepID=A0ABR9D8S8_9GAMM|nr:NAD(P)-dependent alcohol dehydrogenase [Methylomonas albis]MBD9358327.1 NAD(P)-dependent alcohol dehydrogenase [Methylomonas albis]CAD6881716.1 Alcohol dehydrogenase (EC 1.1.1.1) [Methylomonas albis]